MPKNLPGHCLDSISTPYPYLITYEFLCKVEHEGCTYYIDPHWHVYVQYTISSPSVQLHKNHPMPAQGY